MEHFSPSRPWIRNNAQRKKSTVITDDKDWTHSRKWGGKEGKRRSTLLPRTELAVLPCQNPTVWMKCDSCALDKSKSSVIWKSGVEEGKRKGPVSFSFCCCLFFSTREREPCGEGIWPLFCRRSRDRVNQEHGCYTSGAVQRTGLWTMMQDVTQNLISHRQ